MKRLIVALALLAFGVSVQARGLFPHHHHHQDAAPAQSRAASPATDRPLPDLGGGVGVVPEPETYVGLIVGLLGVAWIIKRRKK